MADIISDQQPTPAAPAITSAPVTTSPIPSGVDPSVHQMMMERINPGALQTQPTTETPAATTNEPTTPDDTFAQFKEKFGYETPEAAFQEIEQLRALREKPTPAEIKFENEQSEKIYKALLAGKEKEVYEILAQQERLSSLTGVEVTKDSAADIIKLGMQLKYKDLTPQEIDYKYSKEFGIPREPVQKLDEADEDFAERKADWQTKVDDIEMNKIIEAKLAKPELAAAKAKLIFPETNAPEDEGYLQYKKSLEEKPKTQAAIEDLYKKVTADEVETKMDFNDEANKVAFQFQFKPDDNAFSEVRDMAIDINKFFDRFVKSDGSPDRTKFLKALNWAINGETMLMEGMKQAKNATIKANLPDNTEGGLVRNLPAQNVESELDKAMRLAGVKRQ